MQSKTYFIPEKKNKQILFRHWHVQNPKVCICLIHDIGSHSGTFQYLADFFTNIGYAVCAIELQGHGQSSGKRGHIFSYQSYYSTVDILLKEAENNYPGSSKLLYGQGLGGNIALNYYFTHKNEIKGLIISSPWFKLTTPPLKFFISCMQYLQYIFPKAKLKLSKEHEVLSQDIQYLKQVKNDPDIYNYISLRLFMLAYYNGRKIAVQGYRVSKPMLLLHGTDDSFASHKASVEFSRNTGQFTTFKSWPGGLHELHNDIIRNEVFDDMNQWINKIL